MNYKKRRRWKITLLFLLPFVIGLTYYVSRNIPSELIIPPVFQSPKPVGGKILEFTHTASLPIDQVNARSRAVYAQPTLPAAKNGVEEYTVVYTSQDARNGNEIKVKGRLYLPVGISGAPVLGFGPGTSGPGPQCAPTLEGARGKNWGQYDQQMSFYAGQGMAVALTDYDGRLSENGIHHYFVGEMEGRVMLDMVRALKSFKDQRFTRSPAGDSVFFAGYSQGGHAALWADQLASSYAPDVRVEGVIGFAAATDLMKTFYDTGAGTRTTWIPPYLYAGYDDYYDLKLPAGSLFKEPFAANIGSDARAYCIDQVETITGYYGTPATIANYYQPEFLEALRAKTLPQKFPELATLLAKNRAGTAATSAPKLILGGKKDNVITESAQIELIKLLCSYNTANVQAEIYPEGTHYTTMSLGWPRVLIWLDQVQSNKLPASQCGSYR